MIKYPKKLNEKIVLVCKALQRPYHLLTRITIGTYMFEIYDGTTDGNIINWTGLSPANAVDIALEYLTHEIEMGAVEMPVLDEKKKDAVTSKPVTKRKKRVVKKNK